MTATVTTKSRIDRLRKSYSFLRKHEQLGTPFNLEDLVAATEWKVATIRTYLHKKWTKYVHVVAEGYSCHGISDFTEDEYVRLMSQNDDVSAEPKKPLLKPEAEGLIRKARESALLALQLYNCPTTVFRTEGFTVLMVIAWTSLFHAIFEKRSVAYYYAENDGTPKLIDGDRKAWELSTCMTELWGATDHAVRKNLEFFIRLRNKIEHRFVPAIDPHVAGECQALLLNFDDMVVREFSSYYAIRESLAVPLQTANLRTEAQSDALRKLQARHFQEIKGFVDTYRDGLADTYSDPKYSFRVYLVQKTGNHRSSSDTAIEFVKYDPDRAEEMEGLQHQITLVKDRQVQVANANLLNPTQVVAAVAARLRRRFTAHHHVLAWKRYRVRPAAFALSGCDTKYCVADPRHKDYGYTKAWVEYLVEKLADQAEYDDLTAKK